MGKRSVRAIADTELPGRARVHVSELAEKRLIDRERRQAKGWPISLFEMLSLPPDVGFSVSPGFTIDQGQSATVTYTAEHVREVWFQGRLDSMDGFERQAVGTRTFSPSSDLHISATARSARGSKTSRFTLKVVQPPKPDDEQEPLFPILHLRKAEQTIQGQIYTLRNLDQRTLLALVGVGANVSEVNVITKVELMANLDIFLEHTAANNGSVQSAVLRPLTSSSAFNGREVFGDWEAVITQLANPAGPLPDQIPIRVTLEKR
jgi:hypothetical protein